MMGLLDRIRNLVKLALITKGGSDDKFFAIQQVTYLGKVGDAQIVFGYGHHANLPKDSVLLMFSVGSEDDNRAAIGGMPQNRPRKLPVGEVVFFHPLTGTEIRFRNSGDIDIDTVAKGQDGNLNINTNNLDISVAGNAVIAVAGDATLGIDGIFNVTCPTTNWTGDIIVTGDITTDDVISGGISFNSHVHGGVTVGAGQTGGPV